MSLVPFMVVVFVLLAGCGTLAILLRKKAQDTRTAVSDRKQVELLLEQSELRFRILTRATNEIVWDWNLQTNRLWWNRNIEMAFGYRADDVGLERDWWTEHVHPEDHAAVVSNLQRRLEGREEFWSAEYRFRCADGSYADIFDRGYILRDHDGRG